MIRFNKPAVAASIAALTSLAAAEPVVIEFPLFDDAGGLMSTYFPKDFDSRLPALRLGSIDAGGAGISEVFPYIETDVPDWALPGTSEYLSFVMTDNDDPSWWLLEFNTQPGTEVWVADVPGAWTDPGVSMPNSIGMPPLRIYDRELYDIGNCEYTESNSELVERSDLLFYPFRVQFGEVIFNYGWVALQIVDVRSVDCDFACTDDENIACMRPIIRWVAMGYELEWDTSITVGGGLCAADLNFDAVLDLADLQNFVSAFVAQDAPADFDGNGIFDLADVQGFVGAFNTNCGI